MSVRHKVPHWKVKVNMDASHYWVDLLLLPSSVLHFFGIKQQISLLRKNRCWTISGRLGELKK
jgi:hypothetical protein